MADTPSPASDPETPDRHDAHDLDLIVAILDPDQPEGERAAAKALVANCRSCAALHADLIALARATVEIPTPARPREFTLTAAMAEALARETSREPVPSGARLSHDMNDSRSRHAAHDRLLIANLIDRSVNEAERARAEELLASCRECEQLYDDLVALSAATRSMAVPARPRDFTLSMADADRLRVRGWRRVLAAIGSSRDAFSRPLALGLTTLGLAGLLFATIPSISTGGPTALSTVGNAVDGAAGGAAANPEMAPQASAPAASFDRGPAIAAAPSAAPSEAAASPAAEALPAPSGETGTERLEEDRLFVGSETSPLAGEPDGRDLSQPSLATDGPFDRSAVMVVAGIMLAAGVGLFLLRWTARRLGDG